MSQVNRREQVQALIQTGNFTKAEIAAELGVNAPSVSSQMTYLRWMGNFIISDPETKKLRFCTEEEYNAQQELASASRKAKSAGSNKTPQEQANALAATIAKQEKEYAKSVAKVAQIEKDLVDEPGDADLLELLEEAKANEVLLRLKLKRNKAKAAELPAPVAVATEVEDADDVDPDAEPEGEDDLLD